MQLDIICEIFKFLKRDDLEKCQIVSQNWNKIIEDHEEIFSLRKFVSIGFDCGTFMVVTGESSGFRPEPSQFASFKNCIFEIFYWFYVLEEICIPNLVKTIRDIKVFTQRPLRAVEFVYDAKLDEPVRINHDRKMFGYLEEILGSLVTASKASLTISFEMFREILRDPRILEIPSLPCDVTLSPQNWAMDWVNERFIFLLNAQMVEKFMNSSRFVVSPYTLSGWPASDDFCEEYFKSTRHLMKSKDLMDWSLDAQLSQKES